MSLRSYTLKRTKNTKSTPSQASLQTSNRDTLTASTERFQALGLHNTLSELIEAQRLAQRERLTYSWQAHPRLSWHHPSEDHPKQGRTTSSNNRNHTDYTYSKKHAPRAQPIERRQARAKALKKQYEKSENVTYVDATDYEGRDATAFVVVHRQGHSIGSGSLRTNEPELGEEAVIALAMTAAAKIKYEVQRFEICR